MAELLSSPSPRTTKFERKRLAIVRAAARIINQVGVRGMTFLDVADSVGLTTTSITYYFKKKEMLAEAAFEMSLQWLSDQADAAAQRTTPRDRVAHFIRAELEEVMRARESEDAGHAQLFEIRTMDDPLRTRLGRRYVEIFRKIRGFFGPDDTADLKMRTIVSAHIVMETVMWLPTWLDTYSDWEIDRVHGRIMDVIDNGIVGAMGEWHAHPIADHQPEQASAEPEGVETFLRAATRLVNEVGYRGASVNRIASELDLTKGSFYHYLTSKDDLVVMCFARSYERISHVQRGARAIDAPMRDRFASLLETLLDIQFSADFPLLRFSTLQALPPEVARDVQARAARIAQRYTAMLADGICDGSIRPLDPAIAGRMIGIAINSAIELRKWAVDEHPGIQRLYTKALAHGLFAADGSQLHIAPAATARS